MIFQRSLKIVENNLIMWLKWYSYFLTSLKKCQIIFHIYLCMNNPLCTLEQTDFFSKTWYQNMNLISFFKITD